MKIKHIHSVVRYAFPGVLRHLTAVLLQNGDFPQRVIENRSISLKTALASICLFGI